MIEDENKNKKQSDYCIIAKEGGGCFRLGRRRTAVVFIGFDFFRDQKRRVLGSGTRWYHRIF